MSPQDRLLLSLAGASGCVSCWLVFQSLSQRTLTPTTSATDLTFLAVVTGTIVTILVSRRANGGGEQSAVQRRPLLMAGGVAAAILLGLSQFFDGLSDPGASTITMAREASLAGFAGVGMLGMLLRTSYLRIQSEKASAHSD